MRSFLIFCLVVAACGEPVGQEDGPAPELTRVEGMHDLTDRSALAAHVGAYGVSAADCSPDNLYMGEMIEVTDVGFAYRGDLHTLAEIIDDDSFRFTAPDGAEERIDFDEGSLIRWPNEHSYRTIYLPCS
ncbi:MAG: hypothetical protein HKO13_07760 [Sphingomonas sp.]|nr:hypothetical protein [Sphingomonas sp.]RZV53006.1 MAG: hypothetical protein EX258_01125 [Sphingomonadaceae bacterium]